MFAFDLHGPINFSKTYDTSACKAKTTIFIGESIKVRYSVMYKGEFLECRHVGDV